MTVLTNSDIDNMNTLFDKIWDKHVVQVVDGGPTQLYIDRLYCHEVTSPQAFEGMRARGLQCFRPAQIFCMPDHNTPTHDQDKPIADPVSATQVATLEQNAKDYNAAEYEKAQNALIAYHGRYVYYLVTSINHELEDVIRDVIAEYAAGN